MNENCIARMWNYICCPNCDFMWNSGSQAIPAGSEAPDGVSSDAPKAETLHMTPPGLKHLFEALDYFVAEVKKIPGAAENSMIKEHLDRLPANKADILNAFAEGEKHGQAYMAQLGSFVAAAEERREAHRQKMEEVNKKSEPLDGVALGKGLLKTLGFTQ
jgi:hypothetical protein